MVKIVCVSLLWYMLKVKSMIKIFCVLCVRIYLAMIG